MLVYLSDMLNTQSENHQNKYLFNNKRIKISKTNIYDILHVVWLLKGRVLCCVFECYVNFINVNNKGDCQGNWIPLSYTFLDLKKVSILIKLQCSNFSVWCIHVLQTNFPIHFLYKWYVYYSIYIAFSECLYFNIYKVY